MCLFRASLPRVRTHLGGVSASGYSRQWWRHSFAVLVKDSHDTVEVVNVVLVPAAPGREKIHLGACFALRCCFCIVVPHGVVIGTFVAGRVRSRVVVQPHVREHDGWCAGVHLCAQACKSQAVIREAIE